MSTFSDPSEDAVVVNPTTEEKDKVLEAECPAIALVVAKLAALYEIHDFYHTSEKGEKQQMVRDAVDAVAAGVDAIEATAGAAEHSGRLRARLAFLRGRALDALDGYTAAAEEALSRAVKLEPDDVAAWNALAHCFWKKGDLAAARSCYESALSKRKTKETLRQLSMVTRQMLTARDREGSVTKVIESVGHAKAAVALDLSDAESWYVLGNGYVSLFFRVTRSLADLDRATAAYAKAEACDGADANPDLFFNRGNLRRYQERYAEAAADYARAHELDPSLPATENLRDMAHWRARVGELVLRQGRLKPKRLKELAAPLRDAGRLRALLPPGSAHELVASPSELAVGSNKGKAVALAVAVPLRRGGDSPPDTFLTIGGAAAGAEGGSTTCVSLSVYNSDTSKLKEKAVVIVLDPKVVEVAAVPPALLAAADEAGAAVGAEGKENATAAAARPYVCLQVDDAKTLIWDAGLVGRPGVALPALYQNEISLQNFEH